MKKTIELLDKEYPRLLKKIENPPQRLYYKGDWNLEIFENCLAVVGSRKMTSYGKRVTEKIVGELAMAGITIVSGFMYGIDATSHRACLSVGGRTIAVMPCGIDLIHPGDQKFLYYEILKNKGLIISEYKESFPPAKWTYPKRNRIVAGLSQATLVIEANSRSGSLITANFAKQYKRKLFAVPGPITSENSKGTLSLIRQGAEMVVSAKEILEFYKIKNKKTLSFQDFNYSTFPKEKLKTKSFSADNLEQKILEQLQKEPLEIDALARILDISISELGAKLSLMQLKGLLFQEENKYYVS